MPLKFAGLIAAPFTPMLADGSLNLSVIPRQAKALADSRVSGAFICGTTGEGTSLTINERMQMAGQWMAAAPASLRVIVHVGSNSVSESQALAAHAQSLEAAAIAAIAPTFFRATTVDHLVNYCAQVAKAAPALPFYYYHMPALAGADVPMHDFLTVAGKQIPNLAGIKFTHENLMDYSRCLSHSGSRYNILWGRDEVLLAALAMGAPGAVGSTYNYMPVLYHRIMNAFEAGELETARQLQDRAIQVITIMSRHGGLPAGKAMMKLAGLDCGPVRAPLQNLSAAALESLTNELAHVGFPDEVAEFPSERIVKPADRATALKRTHFIRAK